MLAQRTSPPLIDFKLKPYNEVVQAPKVVAENDAFPHEIGVFLGYPLGDVMGFIRSGGRNCRHAGCWKVYCNEAETLRLFEKFKKCRDVYLRLWNQGRSVLQLTVAA